MRKPTPAASTVIVCDRGLRSTVVTWCWLLKEPTGRSIGHLYINALALRQCQCWYPSPDQVMWTTEWRWFNTSTGPGVLCPSNASCSVLFLKDAKSAELQWVLFFFLEKIKKLYWRLLDFFFKLNFIFLIFFIIIIF